MDVRVGKEPTCQYRGSIPGWGRSPKEEMATYSGILAWEIPWTEEPAGLQFMGSQRVGHSLGTKQRMHVKPTACRKVLPEEQGVATVGGVGLVDDAGGEERHSSRETQD